METFECPNCAAAIPFHASTVFTVCPYCQSMVVRDGVNVELLGKTSTLPADVSPIQIGTTGKFGDAAFTVLGRVRLRWELGAWTEWFIEFANGATGWLAEAQGFFMVSRSDKPEKLPAAYELKVGKAVSWGGLPMVIADIKEAEVVGCEGELPFKAPPGRKSVCADLTGPNSAFGSIEYADCEMRSFFGRYCQFEELSFANLRAAPGWFGNPPLAHDTGVTAVNCPRCGGESELRAPGSTVTLVCARCGSLLDVATPTVRIIAQAAAKLNIKPLIPLGSRGALFGVEYEAIGFMQRADGYYTWFEYLLFNPHHGYTWLVNYKGHWSFVERLLDFPDETVGGGYAVCDREKYKLFARGSAVVRYVVGEFYWRIKFGEKATTSDFILPPHILSKEEYPELQEVTWSRGTYIDSDELARAFGLKEKLPEPIGVYLNQPNPWNEKGQLLGATTVALVVLLFVIQLVSIAHARNETVANQSFVYVRGDTNQPTPVLEFEVKGAPQPVEVTTAAGVDNSWIELAYELHNVRTHESQQFVEGVEYYYGPDWSEGSTHKSTVVPNVEPGKYQLLIDPDGDPKVAQISYSVQVQTDPPVWRNFWICLAALLAYPGFRFWRATAFEQKRWAESDFATEGFFNLDSGADDE